MFYHDNGKLQVFANTRCGNTNMHHYFGIDRNKQKTFPPKYSDDLIIVLRNPLDRVASAVRGSPDLMEQLFPTLTLVMDRIQKKYSKELIEEIGIFKLHCNPYLYKIANNPFRILDFNMLDQYIPRDTKLFQSPTTNSRGYTSPEEVYVPNSFFSLPDLEKEYEVYLELMDNREQISIIEWKEKTT